MNTSGALSRARNKLRIRGSVKRYDGKFYHWENPKRTQYLMLYLDDCMPLIAILLSTFGSSLFDSSAISTTTTIYFPASNCANVVPTSITVFKTLAIYQHFFHCMITYKPTAITTDRKDSCSSVQHVVFSVTQSELPRPIKYDRKSVVDKQQDSSPVQ